MKRMLRPLLLSMLLSASLLACRKEEPWKPVVEPSGFGYLADTVADALEEHQALSAYLRSGDRKNALRALDESRQSLLRLQLYYIPMTEVRQLVYDADRLYFLRRVGESKDLLSKAKSLLGEIGKSDGPALEKEVGEVEAMIDALLLAMDEASSQVPELFGSLGHKVNLLVLKGDLVLAGVRFAEER